VREEALSEIDISSCWQVSIVLGILQFFGLYQKKREPFEFQWNKRLNL
jgi:hypothetical protein